MTVKEKRVTKQIFSVKVTKVIWAKKILIKIVRTALLNRVDPEILTLFHAKKK